MAKSAAKKQREKLIREGKLNPEMNRGIYVLADMRTRKTKTKQEKLNQTKYKKRLSDYSQDGRDKRSFYLLAFTTQSYKSLSHAQKPLSPQN